MKLFEILQRVADVWTKWTKENPRLTDPTVVNNGYCAEFAIEVGEAIPNVAYWSNSNKHFEHVFIEHNGKFYDAECLHGVIDYHELPIWERIALLHGTSVEDITRGCKPVSLQELCVQYGLKYPPTKNIEV